jgi:hypothetical protein
MVIAIALPANTSLALSIEIPAPLEARMLPLSTMAPTIVLPCRLMPVRPAEILPVLTMLPRNELTSATTIPEWI